MTKFNPDLPTLAGEEVDDGYEERAREDIAAELAGLEPLKSFTTDPGWSVFDRYLAVTERDSTEKLLGTRDAAASLEWRARVMLVRELRRLPESTALRVSALMGALEEDDGE